MISKSCASELAWAGASCNKEKKIDLNSISETKTIYKGPAEEACKLFPKNVNVAAALSLAGVGPEKTQVQIAADPTIQKNIHEIDVKGEFGELSICTQNVVSPIALKQVRWLSSPQ